MRALDASSTANEVVAHLKTWASEDNRRGMQRYGIRIERALGVPHTVQRTIAKVIRQDHQRAMELWHSGITEAQFIAALTADPKQFTASDAHLWAASFDSWDVVDGISNLFVQTAGWRSLIDEFALNDREFIRRTAFAMIAWASVHRKDEPDQTFEQCLPLIGRYAGDNRNYVWKAVSWALRSIGKRSMALRTNVLDLSAKLVASGDKMKSRIGRDAAKELTKPAIIAAIERRETNRNKKRKTANGRRQ